MRSRADHDGVPFGPGARRAAVVALLLALLLSAQGCGAVVGTLLDKTNEVLCYPFREFIFFGLNKYDNDWSEPWRALEVPSDHGEVLIGLCLSGGGSRSAYFSTCVLDELGRRKVPGTEHSYLEEVDFISSVSGGSLAAAYFCLNWRRQGYPAEHGAFFARMRQDLSKDFELRAFFRGLLGYWLVMQLTYFDSGDLMASVWDSNFFDDKTFKDLSPLAPVLLINATSYDTGHRFVFTPLPLDRLRSYHHRLLEELAGEGQLTTRGFGGQFRLSDAQTLESLDVGIAECPLSTAVAASAAVPYLLGPTNLLARDGRVVHLGDGGIYDNHGMESIAMVMGQVMREEPERPALILVVDGSGYFDSSEQAGTLGSFGGYADRTIEISWLRATALGESIFSLLLRELARRNDPLGLLGYEVISLYDDEAMRSSASAHDPFWVSQLISQLEAVATRFSLSGDGVRAIEEAAPRVTAAALDRADARLGQVRRRLEAIRRAVDQAAR